MIIFSQVFILLKFLVFICIFKEVLTQGNKVSANLELFHYEPYLHFILTFSQPVHKPQFQILLNNNNLTYHFTTTSNYSNIYEMTLDISIHTLNPTVETYSLIFNCPIDIANGRLNLADYILQPKKDSITLTIPDEPAYVFIVLLYISSLFGLIGIRLIDFIQMFLLAENQFTEPTSIYQIIGKSFFLSIRKDVINDPSYLSQISIPLLVVLVTFLMCFTIKHALKGTDNPYLIQIKHFFSYNFFLSTWSIFSLPIFYKAYQFLYLNSSSLILLSREQLNICIFITYVNILATLLYLYIMWFILNPMPNGGQSAFAQYINSQQFAQFQRIHMRTVLDNWKKRNYMILNTVRKYSAVIFYFQTSNLIQILFFQQVMIMLYMNTVRPFKYDFYTYFSIITNLIILIFYMILVFGTIYFDLGQIIVTQVSINSFLRAKVAVFFGATLTILVFSGIQTVRIIFDIKYQIRLHKWLHEDSHYFDKDIQSSQIRKRLYTKSSLSLTKKKSSRIPEIQNLSHSIIFTQKISPSKQQKTIKNSASKGQLDLFEAQMQELKSPQIFKKKRSKRKSNKQVQKSERNESKKWKNKNLLEQLAGSNKIQKKKSDTKSEKRYSKASRSKDQI